MTSELNSKEGHNKGSALTKIDSTFRQSVLMTTLCNPVEDRSSSLKKHLAKANMLTNKTNRTTVCC